MRKKGKLALPYFPTFLSKTMPALPVLFKKFPRYNLPVTVPLQCMAQVREVTIHCGDIKMLTQ